MGSTEFTAIDQQSKVTKKVQITTSKSGLSLNSWTGVGSVICAEPAVLVSGEVMFFNFAS